MATHDGDCIAWAPPTAGGTRRRRCRNPARADQLCAAHLREIGVTSAPTEPKGRPTADPGSNSRVSQATGRRIVDGRSAGRCELCGAHGDGIHHRHKRSQGGSWSPANLLRLCGSGTSGCHGAIEAHPAAATALGLTIPRYASEWALPALVHPHGLTLGWWLPLADGTWDDPARDTTPTDLAYLGVIQAATGPAWGYSRQVWLGER